MRRLRTSTLVLAALLAAVIEFGSVCLVCGLRRSSFCCLFLVRLFAFVFSYDVEFFIFSLLFMSLREGGRDDFPFCYRWSSFLFPFCVLRSPC